MENRARCIVVTGRPGSGKTTLAQQLADLLHMPMLSRDQVKEGLVNTSGIRHDLLPAETNRQATDFFFSVTERFLEARVSLVVEAAFQHKVWSEVLPRWAKSGRLYLIICQADPELCARRHLERGLRDPAREFFHGDKRVRVYRETGEFLGPGDYEPPSFDAPTLHVSTLGDYSPDLPAIRHFIMGTAAE